MYVADEIKRILPMHRVAEYYGFAPGRNGFIQCPFHQGDHTASLKIYPGSGGWHCFGCNKGGSVIDFVMELYSLPFKQAVIRLSSDFNLGLTEKRPNKKEASRILKQRRKEEAQREREKREYMERAWEHCYWWEVKKYFSPTKECAETGYIHPLYAEALKRLPYLEYWLDENLESGR